MLFPPTSIDHKYFDESRERGDIKAESHKVARQNSSGRPREICGPRSSATQGQLVVLVITEAGELTANTLGSRSSLRPQ